MKRTLGAVLAFALALAAPAALAWDPAITQAGLTERALLASGFHKVLSERLGRPLGALEPLALHSRLLPEGLKQGLWERLIALDPSHGYRPDADGVNTAMAWVTAGAVLAETPPERGRHHFLEPGTGSGLDDKGGLVGAFHAVRLGVDGGGGVRDLATGNAFDLTGMASLRWLRAPENELSLTVLDEHLERAVTGKEAAEREAALVRALLALGGVLAALEDAGEPAHVRNDFRGAYLDRQGPSSWDRGSRFERFVSDRYGRSGIPAAGAPVARPTLESFFSARDGGGLADRTQRRFFSDGTVPDEIPVDAAMSPNDVRDAARATLPFAQPSIGRLELRGTPKRRYMMLEGRRALAYERQPDGVRFFLDDAVFADTAKVLLPEVVAYGAGLVNHIFRGRAVFELAPGSGTVKLEGLRGDASGTLTFYAEDADGRRSAIGSPASLAGSAVTEATPVTIPVGTRRLAAVFRGKDEAGPVLVVGETAVR